MSGDTDLMAVALSLLFSAIVALWRGVIIGETPMMTHWSDNGAACTGAKKKVRTWSGPGMLKEPVESD